MHGGHVQSRCHSLKRFLEHVSCSEVAGVGGDFGPFLGRIGHLDQKLSLLNSAYSPTLIKSAKPLEPQVKR